jgi:hypothetical protein
MLLVVLTGCAVNRTVSKENVFSSNINPAVEIEVELGLEAQPVAYYYEDTQWGELKYTLYMFTEPSEKLVTKRALGIVFVELRSSIYHFVNDALLSDPDPVSMKMLKGRKFNIYNDVLSKEHKHLLRLNQDISYAHVSWRRLSSKDTIIVIAYMEPAPMNAPLSWWKELRARGERTFKVVK